MYLSLCRAYALYFCGGREGEGEGNRQAKGWWKGERRGGKQTKELPFNAN